MCLHQSRGSLRPHTTPRRAQISCFQEVLFPNNSRCERGAFETPTEQLEICGEVFIPAVPAVVHYTFSHCRQLRNDTWMGIERGV